MSKISRRRVLRGVLHGGAVTVALPFLNCFLDNNGTALASGEPLPVRFGTWFWGLGMSHQAFIPKKIGANYEITHELEGMKAVRDHVNVFTGFNVYKDSNPNLCHHTGWVTLRSGVTPAAIGDLPGESIDVSIARKIGGVTRFRSLTAAASGDGRDTTSFTGPNARVPPETSPIAFYEKLFGADFQDPNGSTFTPSPRIMTQKSVLSGVMESAKDFGRTLGAEDRARLDQYFTGLRELERQFALQLQKPSPRAACVLSKAREEDIAPGTEVEMLRERHRAMTEIMVMAIACDQTRVFNMNYANPFSATTRTGYEKSHHATSHEESTDPVLGYQPIVSWFLQRAFEVWGDYVAAFAKIKEGDRSLLDNLVIYANSDTESAKTHAIDGIPMFTAGKAGGRLKTGLHVSGEGTNAGTRLGYTLQRAMGLDISSWGSNSNMTSKEIGEILT
jgi:hypothetical protein